MKPPGAVSAPRSLSGEKGKEGQCLRRTWPASPTITFWRENLPDPELVRRAQAGDEEAIGLLLRRHWKSFLAQVRQHCGRCGWVEDVCQMGCLRALEHLGRLRHPEAFHCWVSGFIEHEWRHCSRGCKKVCKKVGTGSGSDGTSQVERLGVVTQGWAAPDRDCLWSALWQEASMTRGRTQRVAVLMLEFYVRYGQFPAVRVVAKLTRSSHGSAERSRVAVLRAWRRRLASLGLLP